MHSRKLRFRNAALAVALISLTGLAACESADSHAISLLRNTNEGDDARVSAIRQLQATGKGALLKAGPELINALDNSKPDVERAAEEALTAIGSDVAGDLVKVTDDARRRPGVLRILRQTTIDNAVLTQVVTTTANGSFGTRLHAAQVLGALAAKNDSALMQLQHLTADPDPQVRMAAIEEAIDLGPSRGAPLVPALIASLGDTVAAVRHTACVGLGTFGAAALQARGVLEKLEKGHDPELAQSARIALSAITGPSGRRESTTEVRHP